MEQTNSRHPGESRDPDLPRKDCEIIPFESLGPGFRRDDGKERGQARTPPALAVTPAE
jgi:hypothetical protein